VIVVVNNNIKACLQCGSGKMYKTGLTKKGQAFDNNSDVDMTIVEYDQFQCDTCGFVEGRAVAAFADKLGILASKDKSTKSNVATKGRAKKIKNTAKPRRHEPR
jgi:predicted nucleic-acid-binding Zn-ribbon protein